MAVYTQISIDELNVFLSKYNIDNINEFSGIKGGTSNSNYLLTADNKKFILTIFEKRTNQENLPFYFDLMNHLNAHDIKCPEAVSYTHLRAHETKANLVCRLLLEKKK